MAGEKPIKFTEHATRRLLDLIFTEDDVIKAIMEGKRASEGKIKFKAIHRTKKGIIVVTCVEYPDHIKIITVNRGR